MTRPNIVFIFSDQQRADTMGYAGDEVAITPHLDRLALEGSVFTRCFASSPVCMTTRASVMSGLQVHQHGVWAFADPGIRFGQSHVRNIQAAGYRTGVVGKTHLWRHGDGHARDHLEEMADWGFDDARETTGPSESVNTDSIYTDYLAEKGLLATHRNYLNLYLNSQRPLPWELPSSQLPTEAHLDMFIASLAEDWLDDNASESQPFYLQVNFGGPHDPWDSPPEYRRMYNADDMMPSIGAEQSGPVSSLVALLKEHAPAKLYQMSRAENQVMKANYYAKVTLIDDCVGRVIDALESKGLMSNTWIVFSADHGEMLGDHGLLAKKNFYEGAVNVPCLFRPPGGGDSRQSRALMSHLDIVATLIDIAGAAELKKSDGRVLRPMLKGGLQDTHQPAVLSELGLPPSVYTMLRTDRYKLSIDTRSRAAIDLYDMQEDPDELHNLVNESDYQLIKSDLIENMLNPMISDLDTSAW